MIGPALPALAGPTRFIVTPYTAQLPTVTYIGTATLLNADAKQAGDVDSAIVKDVPLTIDRRVPVLERSAPPSSPTGSPSTPALRLSSTHTYALPVLGTVTPLGLVLLGLILLGVAFARRRPPPPSTAVTETQPGDETLSIDR
ncbi:hypothetical protein [Rhodococcus ruber]|uniref:hypothetical protein n=1 Tax=Rhodococcus ruber TaxID=1830 RepID=UPI00315C7730